MSAASFGCVNAIISTNRKLACILGAWYTSAPAYIPDLFSGGSGSETTANLRSKQLNYAIKYFFYYCV